MRSVQRWHMLLVVSLIAGAALWLVLVPSDDPSGNARNPAYWWLCVATAFMLGAVAASDRSALVGSAVAAPALLLAGWTAPRGDGDGLWILWFPLLAVLALGLALVGAAGGWVRRRLHS